MATLHIAPGDSAGGSLRCALRDAGLDDDLLSCRDDLSCGPIVSGRPAERAEWWSRYYDDPNIEADIGGFWDRVLAANERLVVWFGRYRASELAFFLAWTDRIGDRPFYFIDVTGLQFPLTRKDGSRYLSVPMQSVGIMNPDMLGSLLGTEKPVTSELREQSRQRWRQLKAENAPFRVVTAEGLVSAPVDYFDPLILERVTTEWKSVARIVGEAMGYNDEPYIQVGDMMLQARAVALVEQGKLLADGDPWDRRSGRVRLPN